MLLGAAWLVCTALLALKRWTKWDVKTFWIILTMLFAPFMLVLSVITILVWLGYP